jgi:hypothetical protein
LAGDERDHDVPSEKTRIDHVTIPLRVRFLSGIDCSTIRRLGIKKVPSDGSANGSIYSGPAQGAVSLRDKDPEAAEGRQSPGVSGLNRSAPNALNPRRTNVATPASWGLREQRRIWRLL